MVEYILRMQKMLEHRMGLEIYTCSLLLKPAWQTVKYGPKPITDCVTMTQNNCSPRTKSHEAHRTQKSSGGRITDP